MQKNPYRPLAVASAIAICLAQTAIAEPKAENFRVLGTWSTGIGYDSWEKPLWETEISEASGGRLTAEVQSITELGLAGSEVLKLADSGAYDAVFGLYSYVVSGNSVFESLDVPFMASSPEEQKAIIEAQAPVLASEMERVHNIKILANYPFPMPVLVCRDEFTSLADVKGRTVRVLAPAQADLVEGLGGIPINIPFAEVPTALQRGVVDCGMASALAVYLSKWFDVANYVYAEPISPAIGFVAMSMRRWNELTPEDQAIIAEKAQEFGENVWADMSNSDQQGFACLTGDANGGQDCQFGTAANMVLVPVSPDDAEIRAQARDEKILPGFKARCGDDCFAAWEKKVEAGRAE